MPGVIAPVHGRWAQAGPVFVLQMTLPCLLRLVVRCRIVTSRRGRSAVPVLTALLMGAAFAGTATVIATPTGGAADGSLNIAATFSDTPRGTPGLLGRGPSPSSDVPVPSSTLAPPPPTTTTTTTAPPEPPPSTATPAPPPRTSPAEQVVALVNQVRVENGCPAVRVDDRLAAAANAHSADMSERGYFAHTTPEGVTFDKRILNAGYPSPGAENIARGQTTATAVMDAWMKSRGHRANILNCKLTAIGVGLATKGWYWTQDFGY